MCEVGRAWVGIRVCDGVGMYGAICVEKVEGTCVCICVGYVSVGCTGVKLGVGRVVYVYAYG